MRRKYSRSILLIGLLAISAVGLSACGKSATQSKQEAEQQAAIDTRDDLRTAIFAAGCFWCVEQAFDEVAGVLRTTSGYIGGDVPNPDYRAVSSGRTGHTEALEVRFDPALVSYEQLLGVFWHNVDPTDAGGQFCDRGRHYRGGIFYLDAAQQALAEASKVALQNDPDAPKPIVSEITQATAFYAAEEYHQDYHRKNPVRYNYYKNGCGRPDRLEELWGPK